MCFGVCYPLYTDVIIIYETKDFVKNLLYTEEVFAPGKKRKLLKSGFAYVTICNS